MNINLKNGTCDVSITTDCNEEKDTQVHPDNLTKIDPSNPANAMDEIGQAHNYFMKRIFLSTGETEFNLDEVVEKIAGLIKKYPFKTKALANANSANVPEIMHKISDPLFNSLKYNWLFPPTPEQMEIFPDFLRDIIVWGGKLMESFDKSTDSLIEHKEKLIAYEQTIIDSKMRKNLKEASLVAMSMIRHSSLLYIEYFNTAGGDTGTGIMAKGKCKCKAVARVAVADVVGAAQGYESGGFIGGLIGGIIGSGKQIGKELA